jgi:hypothetical protein
MRSVKSGPGLGIPLFHSANPEVGPTAQLVEILVSYGMNEDSRLFKEFVRDQLERSPEMQETFSWHLASVLAVSDLCDLQASATAAV